MTIKGLDQLRKHVPELNTPLGILYVILLPVILFILVNILFTAFRMAFAVWQLAAEILLGSLGFGLVYLFFRHKENFKARFGPLAYSRAAWWLGYPGVIIIAAMIAHIRNLPGTGILHYRWSIILPMLGWMMIIMGVLLALRAMQVFGIDNLTMLYVYFPEESHLVNHQIYNILRHPAYAAVQFIVIGLALLNGTWVALTCALFFALGLWAWVHFVEEKELIQRFGAAYVEYRKRVPAFEPHLRNLRDFFVFLIVGR